MATPSTTKEVKLEFVLPPDMEQGVYATVAQVRATPWDYIITFLQPIMPVGEGPPPDTLEARAVARVLVPRGFIGPLIDVLQTAQKAVEATHADKASAE
jgi:hypothetical protein